MSLEEQSGRCTSTITTSSTMSESSIECGASRADVVARRLRPQSKLVRCVIAEMFATGFMLYCGFNVSATFVLSKELNSTGNAIGWGLASTFAIMMAYNISGAHVNPAVSLTAYTLGQISFTHFVFYSLAQTTGAFVASALVFAQYYDLINAVDGGVRQILGPNGTATIFATYPHGSVSELGAAVDQVLCTAVLCIALVVITEPKNKIPRWAQPPLIGCVIGFMSLGFALNGGCAMNPARDLGPRIFSLLVGYGWEVFSFRNYTWFWVPVFGPLLGALMGTWAYIAIIKPSLDDPEPTLPTSMKSLLPNEKVSSVSEFGDSVTMPPEYTFIHI